MAARLMNRLFADATLTSTLASHAVDPSTSALRLRSIKCDAGTA